MDALLASGSDSDSADVVAVALDDISPNPFQPRRTFDEEKLKELADSISVHGVVQPIILRPAGAGYELIAGERRWRAAMLAGLAEIPALVEDLGDRDVMEIALIENLQREDLNPVEEARAYRVLQDEFGLNQRELAERVGVSRPQVANVLRLLGLPEAVQALIGEGRISMGHAKVIMGVPEERREAFAHHIAERGLSVRAAERAAPSWEPQPRQPSVGDSAEDEGGAQDVFLRDIEHRLTAALSARVRLKARGKKGSIVIEYRDYDELERLLGSLGVEEDA